MGSIEIPTLPLQRILLTLFLFDFVRDLLNFRKMRLSGNRGSAVRVIFAVAYIFMVVNFF